MLDGDFAFVLKSGKNLYASERNVPGMDTQKFWQLDQPQGTPLYTLDVHNTQTMYVKRMFLFVNRLRLWQLAVPAALLLLYINSASVLGVCVGIFNSLCVFLARSMAVSAYKSNETARAASSSTYTFYEDCFTVQSSYPKARFGMTTFTGSLCGSIPSARWSPTVSAMPCVKRMSRKRAGFSA